MIIIDFIINLIILVSTYIWKKIIKKIIFLITKTHQIERIMKYNIQSFFTYKVLCN